jgi:lipopolysaccharide transport system permease protein
MELHEYLPYLALSLVLWNFVNTLVGEACSVFTEAEGMIRSMRMPYVLYALRVLVRNALVLAHNVIVIVAVFLIFLIAPGPVALLAVPALTLWAVDTIALSLALGAFCARFRDVPPIVASVMQLAFFLSPIIWQPAALGEHARRLLPLNPFYSLFEIVRGPLLGQAPNAATVLSALGYSVVLCAVSWLFFVRVRGRLAFWV